MITAIGWMSFLYTLCVITLIVTCVRIKQEAHRLQLQLSDALLQNTKLEVVISDLFLQAETLKQQVRHAEAFALTTPESLKELRTLKEQHGLLKSQIRMSLDKLAGRGFKNKHGPLEQYKVFKQMWEAAK